MSLATDIAVQPFNGTWTALSHANSVNDTRVLDDDVRTTSYGTEDGATDLVSRALAYGDDINLTAVTDTLNAANNETYSYTPSNRLEDTTGPWGGLDFVTDGVGNRSSQVLTAGMSTITDVYALASSTNRISSVTTNGTPSRAFTYDLAGNTLTDTKGGVTTTYTYNGAGRMASLTVGSLAQEPYLYDGFGQLASRKVTANPTRTLHMIYDQDGNLIFEADGSTGEMLREYIWLQGRPVAVIDAAADSSIYAVHVDHLDRPIMMTHSSGAIVWRADYLPFGEVRTSSGPASLAYRFPGQWFMLETGLHYNWHRWYDATMGRYTQPDPIGMPDGPSRFAYARNSPMMYVDPDGQQGTSVPGILPIPLPLPPIAIPGSPENRAWTEWATGFLKSCFGTDDDDDECDRQYEEDSEICRSLQSKNARARCWASAADRLGDCKGGRPPRSLRY